jgi:hypothetical protein
MTAAQPRGGRVETRLDEEVAMTFFAFALRDRVAGSGPAACQPPDAIGR